MTRISTRTHGVLDFAAAATLFALPRMLGWGGRLTGTLTAAAVGTVGYSLLTKYEFGLVPVLPMRAHLALDAAGGVALCAAPAFFPEEDDATRAALVGLGLFEVAAALLTRPVPFEAESLHMARELGQETGREAADFAAGVRRSSTSAML